MAHRLSVTAMTHRGAVRSGNEDAIGIGAWATHADMDAPVQRLVDLRSTVACAVADGMGGHQAGSLASRFLISRLAREVRNLTDHARISAFLRRLDADLIRLGADHGYQSPPGSTIAAVLFRPAMPAIIFNVGDSRVYRLRDGSISALTTDDTLGGMNGEDGRTGSRGHVLTQAIGGKHAPERIEPHMIEDAIDDNGAYLLCTDGVSDLIGNSELSRLAADASGDDIALTIAIFDLAMERGGRDNISICIARPTT